MGGDLFALVSTTTTGRQRRSTPRAARGSGADAARLRAEGLVEMPFNGRHPLGARCRAASTDGSRSTSGSADSPSIDVLAPAIGYARDGFPASTDARGVDPGAPSDGRERRISRGPSGSRAPGEVIRRPGVARALERSSPTDAPGSTKASSAKGS